MPRAEQYRRSRRQVAAAQSPTLSDCVDASHGGRAGAGEYLRTTLHWRNNDPIFWRGNCSGSTLVTADTLSVHWRAALAALTLFMLALMFAGAPPRAAADAVRLDCRQWDPPLTDELGRPLTDERGRWLVAGREHRCDMIVLGERLTMSRWME